MMCNVLKPGLLVGAMLVGASAWAQHDFVIKGKLYDTARNGEKVAISYNNGTRGVYVGVVVKDGAYEYKGTTSLPVKVSLSMTLPVAERKVWAFSEKTEFYVEEGTVSIEGQRLATSVVKADGQAQQDFLLLQAALAPFDASQQKAYENKLKGAIAKDSVAIQKYDALIGVAKAEMDSAELAFIGAHPASFVSLWLTKDRVTPKALAEDRENTAAMFNGLAPQLRESVPGKAMQGYINLAYKLQPGKPSVDFTMADTLGKPVALSSFRGKYVLLDFWASWCIPCRFENKTVVKAYNQYKDRNFTVLSVSLEKQGDQKAWMDAIHKDSLTWTHVSDIATGKHQASALYGVQSIPMNYLIGPDGDIVAVHLRGAALMKKLEELLAK